jgi:hypothetical protein
MESEARPALCHFWSFKPSKIRTTIETIAGRAGF